MNKWILILTLPCFVFSQNENLQDLEQNFLHYITNNKKKEELLSYLEDTQNKNNKKVILLIYLISKYRIDFLENNKLILSTRLYSALLKHVNNEDLQIYIFKIFSSLNEKVILSHRDTFLKLVNQHVNDGSMFMNHFSRFFLLEKGNIFPELLPLIIMDEAVMPEVIGEILLKYQSKSLLEGIVKRLKQNPESRNLQVTLGLDYCERINYLETMNIIIEMFDQDINTVNEETKEYILDILNECLQKYLVTHKKNIFADLEKRLKNDQLDIRRILIQVCYEKHEDIFKQQNLHEASLYLFPLVFREIDTNPLNYWARKLLLLLDSKVLTQHKSELEKVFTKHIAKLSDVLGELILKKEAFIDFLPILLNSPNQRFDALFKIYEKYQEKTLTYFEQGLKGSDNCKKRIITVMLWNKDSLAKKFLTENFIEVFNNLNIFPSPDYPIHNFRRLMAIIDIADIMDIIILEKVDIFHYTSSNSLYENIIEEIINILKDKNFEMSRHLYLQNLQNWRLGIPQEIILEDNAILRKNLLEIITVYKMNTEDAIFTVLYYLADRNLKSPKEAISIFPQQKIRETLKIFEKKRDPNDKYHISYEQLVVIKQKLIDIFGENFFMEENKE